MEEEYKFQIKTNKIQSQKIYSEDIDILTIPSSDIKEIGNHIYEINITDLIFISHQTKIYIGYAKDKNEVICIRQHSMSDAIDLIESAKMINNGIIILNDYIFKDCGHLQVTLNKKLENPIITIFNCRRLINGLIKEL